VQAPPTLLLAVRPTSALGVAVQSITTQPLCVEAGAADSADETRRRRRPFTAYAVPLPKLKRPTRAPPPSPVHQRNHPPLTTTTPPLPLLPLAKTRKTRDTAPRDYTYFCCFVGRGWTPTERAPQPYIDPYTCVGDTALHTSPAAHETCLSIGHTSHHSYRPLQQRTHSIRSFAASLPVTGTTTARGRYRVSNNITASSVYIVKTVTNRECESHATIGLISILSRTAACSYKNIVTILHHHRIALLVSRVQVQRSSGRRWPTWTVVPNHRPHRARHCPTAAAAAVRRRDGIIAGRPHALRPRELVPPLVREIAAAAAGLRPRRRRWRRRWRRRRWPLCSEGAGGGCGDVVIAGGGLYRHISRSSLDTGVRDNYGRGRNHGQHGWPRAEDCRRVLSTARTVKAAIQRAPVSAATDYMTLSTRRQTSDDNRRRAIASVVTFII